MVRGGRAYGWQVLAARRASRSAGRLVVLTFHGVRSPEERSHTHRNLTPIPVLRRQLQFLRRLPVLDPDEATLDPARSGVVLTFDDAYRNSQVAAELLAEAGLPWLLAVPAGVVGSGRSIWTVELSLLLLRGRARSIEVLGRSWPLDTDEARRSTFDAVRNELKRRTATQRRDFCVEIEAQFPLGQLDELLDRNDDLRLLDWRQISELAVSGVRIGSHGLDHEILHRDQDPAEVEREVAGSRAEIERRLGRAPELFVYPDGRCAPATVAAVAAAGYRLALTTEPGTASSATSPHLVPRWEMPADDVRAAQLLARELR